MTHDQDKPLTPAQARKKRQEGLENYLAGNAPETIVFRLMWTKKASRIERIISNGQASPDELWYDQDQAEWIVVLKGEAMLLIQGAKEPVHLQVGDYVLIPAHHRHRVEWTSPDEPAICLAVFYN